MKVTYCLAMLLPIPEKYDNRFSLSSTSKSLSKEFNLISPPPNGTRENSKRSIIILIGFPQTPRIFTTIF